MLINIDENLWAKLAKSRRVFFLVEKLSLHRQESTLEVIFNVQSFLADICSL